jgi:hypothetical protein
MYYPDDGEQAEQRKDIFIIKVMGLLFGEEATYSEDDGSTSRCFSFQEALDELEEMNNIYTEYLISTAKDLNE